PCSINQVVRFSENQGFLVADWPILTSSSVRHSAPGDAPHPLQITDSFAGRIPLTDLPGHAKIWCIVGHGPVPIIAPTFEYWELRMPQAVRLHLQVLSGPTHLQVVQDF